MKSTPFSHRTRNLAAVPRRSVRRLAVAGLLVTTASLVSSPTLSPVSLTGSSFEIDPDANLVVNTGGKTDWASLAHATASDPEKRATDLATGTNDNSYKGGVKEDTTCPAEETGSIPNNKSDLLTFHVYAEPGAGSHPGFLNLGWSRVTDPSGATLMDFEFNQGSLDVAADKCASGPNVKRRAGDLLIEYGLASSGTSATITKRVWSGSAWGTATDLSANDPACGNVPCAEGRVNTSAITADNADGIGARSARTFGEASLDLRAIFSNGVCAAFGTATLKSRSSESFTSQLKDFLSPIKVNIDNCASITINKVTENGDSSFAFGATGTGLSGFNLGNGGQKQFLGLGAGSYTVTENLTAAQVTAGWSLKDLSCTENGSGTAATENPGTGTASITLANGGDVVCTYTNHKKLSPTVTTKLNGESANISATVGSAVYDTATLTGASANAGGTVTYTAYSDGQCTVVAGSGGVQPVTAGVVTQSDPVTFIVAGTYYWKAVYSGDANNFGATSNCQDEVLSITKKSPGASTAQNLKPNDSFTLTGGFSATGNVTFSLYGPSDPTCAGTAALTETVALSGGNSAATNNTTFVASAEGTWRWKVVYVGDTNNNGVTLACGHEAFTIDNNTTN